MYIIYNISLYRVYKDRVELLYDRFYRSKSNKEGVIVKKCKNYKLITYITKLSGNFKESDNN